MDGNADRDDARRRIVEPGEHRLDETVSSGIQSSWFDVRRTEAFDRWLDGLRDRQARARILARIRRLTLGNPGDVGPVGEGVSEMRIDWGPGYRVYLVQRGKKLAVLLNGGDKRTQKRDIRIARELARSLQKGDT